MHRTGVENHPKNVIQRKIKGADEDIQTEKRPWRPGADYTDYKPVRLRSQKRVFDPKRFC